MNLSPCPLLSPERLETPISTFPSTPKGRLRASGLGLWLGCVLGVTSCLKEPLETRRSDAAPSATQAAVAGDPQGELASGAFELVSKEVSGTVSLEHNGEAYELVVRNVRLNDVGPVHVYFVGLDRVRSTADLDGVDAKYDFGPLEEVGSGSFVTEHRVRLPSKPKSELRSVALINPRFGVVLASASLRAIGQ